MPWDQKIVPDAFLASAISAASAAVSGQKENAFMSHIQTGIGTSWKRQLLRDDVVVFEGNGSGLIPFSGRTFTVPPVTKTSISNADIDTGEWVHRVIHASDSTKYVANLVTKTGGAGPGFLTDDLVSPNDVNWGSFTMVGPSLDPLSISFNAPTNITSSGFTLSANILGTAPPGSVWIFQWIDNRATGIWRESPRVPVTSGTISHSFTGAPPSTTITYRAFVFTEPDIIHTQSPEFTLTTTGSNPAPDLVSTMISHMGLNSIDGVEIIGGPPSAGWRTGATRIKGGDLRSAVQPVWWNTGGANPVPGNPRFDLNTTYWDWGIPWNWVWDLPGHQTGLNARLALRNQELWVFHDDTNQWTRLSVNAVPTGDVYRKDQGGSGEPDNTGYGVNIRIEADNSAVSIRADAGSVGNFHGYGNFAQIPRPWAVRAVVSRVQMRKIVHDPNLPDQRDLAQYGVTSGADSYPAPQGPSIFNPVGYNPGIGQARWVRATNDWQWIYFINLSTAQSLTQDWISPTTFPAASWGLLPNDRLEVTPAWLAANPPPFEGFVAPPATLNTSDILEAMNGPAEARLYGWGSYGNDPANVAFVGGNNAGKSGPGVNYAGPRPRGNIHPNWWKADANVRTDYKDGDPWPFLAGLGIIAERAPLNDAFQSLHNNGSNVGVALRRQIIWILRESTNQYVKVRDSTVHGLFWTDAVTQLYLDPQPQLITRSNPDGGGVIIKWPTTTENTLHMLWGDSDVLPVQNGRMNFSSFFNDCAAIAYACEIKLVDWDPNQPSQLSGAQLGAYIGMDAYPESTSIVGEAGNPGDNRPGVASSKQYLLTPNWRWMVAMTGRTFGRQDHTGGTSYGGITTTELQTIGAPSL